jgi:transcriptional regulator with XRE-family HTH domain
VPVRPWVLPPPLLPLERWQYRQPRFSPTAPRASQPALACPKASWSAALHRFRTAQRPSGPALCTIDLHACAEPYQVSRGLDVLGGHAEPIGAKERFVNMRSAMYLKWVNPISGPAMTRRKNSSPTQQKAAVFTEAVRQQLRAALEERPELSQADLASALGVANSVITRQLRGYADLSLGRVAEISWSLGLEPAFELRKPTKQQENRQTAIEDPKARARTKNRENPLGLRSATLPPEHLGERIQYFRTRLGLSLRQAALSVGVSIPAFCHWEHGRTRPRPDKLPDIARTLHVSLDSLVGSAAQNDPNRPLSSMHVLERAKREVADAFGVSADRVQISVD